MRVPSGSVDRYLAFKAVDATDLKTPETGLSGFTVYHAKDGAAESQYTTPTTVEIDATNMPGMYWLLLDENPALTAGHDTEEVVVHIHHASMAPVDRSYELYRPKFTEGQSATMANSAGNANLTHWKGTAPDDLIAGHVQADMQAVLDGVLTAAKFADAFLTAAKIAADAFTAAKFHADVTTEFQSGLATAAALAVTDGKIDAIDNFLDTEIATILAAVDTEIAQILADLAAVGVIVDAIKTKTDGLPGDPADASVVAGLIAALEAKIDIVDTIIDSITSRIPAALAAGGQIKAHAEVVDDKSDYALSAAGQAAVADKLLGRTRAGGADGGRTVAQCLAFGRNRWEISGGTLTVYADDDATPLYTAAVATAAGDPITGVDPV